MRDVFICDAVRTPIGRYGGASPGCGPTISPRGRSRRSSPRNSKADVARSTRSFTAAPTRQAKTTAMSRGWRCCSQGSPTASPASPSTGFARPASTRSAQAARAIRAGEIDLAIAGGVEIDDAGAARHGQGGRGVPAHGRGLRHDHRLALHQSADEGAIRRRRDGARPAENVAEEYQVSRQDQDAFALRSQQRAGKAMADGFFAEEIVAVEVPGGKAGPTWSTPTSIRGPTPRPSSSLSCAPLSATPAR